MELSRDQLEARAVIRKLEGDVVEVLDDYVLVLETFDGRVYRVDREAKHILVSDRTVATDLTELEEKLADPMFYGAQGDPSPGDDGFYEELREVGGVTDFHSDRAAELIEERREEEAERAYLRRLEMGP